jgi:hypothetical protein
LTRECRAAKYLWGYEYYEGYTLEARKDQEGQGGALTPSSYYFQLPQRHPVSTNPSQMAYVPDPSLYEQPGLFLQLAGKEDLLQRGYIGLHQQGSTHNNGLRNLSTRVIKPDNVDRDFFKEWLQHYDIQHTCKSDPSSLFLLPGFKVIDTATRRIILAPIGCEYVAPSYVWGVSTSEEQLFISEFPFPAPLTIEDAITSIRALGFRYLWVDRYCVNQTSHAIKGAMIQNIDKIYMSATLILVDATGSSSHNGLAGISRPRNPPKYFQIHGQQLSVIADIESEVRQSKWNSRGWTYQEAILSRRRFVFAHSQVYFQCLKMHCCESLATYLVSKIPQYRSDLADRLQVFPFHGSERTAVTVFNDRLSEFVARDLTYESDNVNAFTGILRQLWRSPNPVYSFWGLPFQPGDFLTALLWSLVRQSNRLILKRPMLPSYTWGGWKGVEGLRYSKWTWPDHRFDVLVSIEEASTGNRISPEDYVASMNELWIIDQFKFFVDLTGLMAHARFTKVNVKRPPLEYDDLHIGTFHKTPEAKITNDTMIGLELILKKSSPIFLFVTQDGGLTGMVLKHVNGILYERTGALEDTYVEPMIILNDRSARLRKRDWDQWTWSGCERKTIQLG